MSSIAYVDSSCLVAIALREPAAQGIKTQLARFTHLVAHPLVEAEVLCACHREDALAPESDLDRLTWVSAPEAMRATTRRVLAVGCVRGADALHLATALEIAARPRDLTFLTLDTRQRDIAKKLGFRI